MIHLHEFFRHENGERHCAEFLQLIPKLFFNSEKKILKILAEKI